MGSLSSRNTPANIASAVNIDAGDASIIDGSSASTSINTIGIIMKAVNNHSDNRLNLKRFKIIVTDQDIVAICIIVISIINKAGYSL